MVNSPRGSTKWASASFSVPVEDLLVELGELAADGDAAVAPRGEHVGERRPDPAGGLKGDEGVGLGCEGLEELAPVGGAARRPADEAEAVAREAGDGHRGGDRRGAGDGDDRHALGARGGDEARAGVADAWGAGLGHEGDVVLGEGPQELRDAGGGVVLLEAQEPSCECGSG